MRSSHRRRMSPGTDVAPAQRLLQALAYPLKLVIQVGLLGAALATLAPLLAGAVPLLAMFESFRLQLCVGGAILAVLGLLFQPRWMAALGVLSLAWNLAIIWPYLPFRAASAAEAGTGALHV